MANEMVECVPNFSEGRDRARLERILDEIRGVSGATLLGVESDADHNRSVVTFVATREAAAEAAFRAVRRASELIDLNHHQGEHPRMGATDVLPFVPLEGVGMEDCVALAKAVGRRIGEELGIPVFLYEEAATRPERRNLADLRRGEFEGLREAIGRDPERRPDFGPERIHATAGAIAVGARNFLIAFNVNLGTADLEVANRIARAMRHSSGGFRFVKAMGVELKGRGIVQVSMNLTDYQRSPLHRVFEAVRREAERYGVAVVGSELVGLVPEAALLASAEWFQRIERFTPGQVIEVRLREIGQEVAHRADVAGFLDRLAARTPTPGGGSAAALAGAMAAALAAMVAALTRGKPKYAGVEAEMSELAAAALPLQQRLAALVEEDAASYEEVLRAMRLPRATDAEIKAREQAIREASLGAARVPLETMAASVATLALLERAARLGNASSATDAAAGGHLALAAVRAARLNVEINLKGVEGDEPFRLANEAARLEVEAEALLAAVLAAARTR